MSLDLSELRGKIGRRGGFPERLVDPYLFAERVSTLLDHPWRRARASGGRVGQLCA